MPSYLLRCLGVPALTGPGGDQVRFRTRKHFALLVRLATEPGRRFSRDYLIDLLWPDAEARLAAHSLAQAISVLKAKIGREQLLTQRVTVALADDAVDADVRHLDRCDVEIAGQFLEGFTVPGARGFDQWQDEMRARLMPKIRDCLVRHMDAGRRVGDYVTVERHARVLQELDPLCEDAARGLIEARAWVGDRGNALRIYGRFEARISEDLGAKPSPELQRIAHLLREGRRRPGVAPNLEPGPPGQRTEKRFDPETLIGRGREFGTLYDAWLEARRRRPRIVLLTADPGVGKTTLANAFAATCQMDGGVVARAQAYDAERELPFAVLAELVRQLTIQRAIGSADPEALSELTRITPEIFRVFPGVPKPMDWAAEITPLRLAGAFLKVVAAAADESPVLLVVDDVHAADNASAAILHLVARKLAKVRVLTILAARRSELRASAAPAALASDASIEALQPLEMEPLPPDAAATLVARLAAPAVAERGEPPADRILRASSGNPLALELLTKEWVEHGPELLLRDLSALDTLPAATIGIPRAIRVVFERQARRLDPGTRGVLDLAAILGRRLAELPLYAAVDCAPGVAAEALSRLLEDGYLRDVHGDLEFRNELIRAQAYYAVPGKARQQLHRRLAELLERPMPGTDGLPHLEIAWHYLRGADTGSAVPHAVKGAEISLEVGAPYEAEQVLDAILKRAGQSGVDESIVLLLARALMDQSKGTAAFPLLQRLLRQSHLPITRQAEGFRLLSAATYLVSPDSGETNCEIARMAVRKARESADPRLVSRALFELARAGGEAGAHGIVSESLNELEGLRQNAPDDPTVLHGLAFCYFHRHDIPQAAEALTRATELLRSTRDLVTLQHALNGLGLSAQSLCHFKEAETHYLESLALAKRMGDDSRASIVRANLCAVFAIQGRYSIALDYGIQSTAGGLKNADQPRVITSYTNLAEVYLLLGEAQLALRCLDQARAALEQRRSLRAQITYVAERASFALMMGNTQAALDYIVKLEILLAGKQCAGPDAGMVDRLLVVGAYHATGPALAKQRARDAMNRYRNRCQLSYLDAVAAMAWVEMRLGATYSDIRAELQLFEELGAIGKRAALTSQGFLTE